jgi:hypothetical protein
MRDIEVEYRRGPVRLRSLAVAVLTGSTMSSVQSVTYVPDWSPT